MSRPATGVSIGFATRRGRHRQRKDHENRHAQIVRTPTVGSVADPQFEIPRLDEVLDPLDHDRADLDAYVSLVDELGAQTILDIGCGTGTFASLLATRGKEVIGVDPAKASLGCCQT